MAFVSSFDGNGKVGARKQTGDGYAFQSEGDSGDCLLGCGEGSPGCCARASARRIHLARFARKYAIGPDKLHPAVDFFVPALELKALEQKEAGRGARGLLGSACYRIGAKALKI